MISTARRPSKRREEVISTSLQRFMRPRPAWGRLERGIYNPTVLKLLAIAGALRVRLRDLV